MADLRQGIVTRITDDLKAVIQPFGSGQALTPPLPMQEIYAMLWEAEYYLLHPIVAVGDIVVYVLFEDGHGVILAKMQEGYSNGYLSSPVGE